MAVLIAAVLSSYFAVDGSWLLKPGSPALWIYMSGKQPVYVPIHRITVPPIHVVEMDGMVTCHVGKIPVEIADQLESARDRKLAEDKLAVERRAAEERVSSPLQWTRFTDCLG